MKALVHVTFKKTVLDPQGRTIQSAIANLGYDAVQDVRQGKFFEIELRPDADAAEARLQVEKIARDVLANPVIEEFRVDMEE